MIAGVALVIAGIPADAIQFVPPASYSEGPSRPGEPPRPLLVPVAEPGAPTLRVSTTGASHLFRANPNFPPAATTRVTLTGAFEVVAPAGTRLTGASLSGFLPVLLRFSDGRCFAFSAGYAYGFLANGRLNRTACEQPVTRLEPVLPAPGPGLRLAGSSGGYAAWVDDQAGTTIVRIAYDTGPEPLFTAGMAAVAIGAMNSIDSPYGNLTLVGRAHGHLTIVTFELRY